MDKQSATNMRGKEIQPVYNVYKDIAPRCSPLSYIANKESGHFSSIGEGVLEDTLEGCENQEEYPEVYYVYFFNIDLSFLFPFFIPVIFSFLMHGSYLCLVPNQQQDSRNMLKTVFS